ncbi:MAG: hypothetical protein HYV40_05995 [Candidatus Levybacteria bacterium]|nr:hypothetical protein [Candidatus Levybacteria bacterium]
MKNLFNKITSVVGTAAILAGSLVPILRPLPAAASTTWNVGDVFAGVAGGSYKVYDNAGVFKETISDGLGGFTTGCAFNGALDKLYTTNFSASDVVVYNDASPHSIAQTIPTGKSNAESVVFAANGHFFIGGPSDGIIEEYDAAGTLVDTDAVASDGTGGPDWIDLASNQTTMFYASEGRNIQRFDVSTDTQLANFAVLPGAGSAFALRLLPPGDGTGGLLVADSGDVKRLDGTGAVAQTYDVAGEDGWFSLNLDPNGTSFWAGDFGTNNFYRFNIASGAVEVGPIASGGSLFGLCLKGELTAAIGDIKLDPPTATNEAGTNHTVTATVTSNGQPAANVLVSFSVVAGPNAGQVSDPGECSTDPNCNTDANGQTSWTYTSNGTAGSDVIEACFTDVQGVEHCAKATKEWTEPKSLPGRMTGGGTIPAGTTTLEGKHGFELHCDVADVPNRLEVNWGKGNKFHLENLTFATCSNDPTLDEEQPVAGFDTYKGKGTGRLNGVSGATAKWTFTDDGEPGTADHAIITITDGVNTYTFSGNLKNGNQQAHPDL